MMTQLLYRGLALLCLGVACIPGCSKKTPQMEVTVYCAVDEPYASKVFADFERETGIRVTALYDVEATKSVGLAARLELEREHPQADVWWGNEAFLTARLASEGVLAPYASVNAADVPADYKDKESRWTGVGLRARVIAIGSPAPGFPITSIHDLADPRLKGKIVMARPTAGSTGAQVAALYLLWGDDKASTFFKSLHDNGVVLVGGNSVVADQVSMGGFQVGLTDSDDVANASANGGKITRVIPDQGAGQEGTMTMPTTVGWIRGSPHPDAARRLIDALVSRATEQKLRDMNFAHWSVRDPAAGGGVKSIPVDYARAAENYTLFARKATAILDGRDVP